MSVPRTIRVFIADYSAVPREPLLEMIIAQLTGALQPAGMN
jgi:hypothetical protein